MITRPKYINIVQNYLFAVIFFNVHPERVWGYRFMILKRYPLFCVFWWQLWHLPCSHLLNLDVPNDPVSDFWLIHLSNSVIMNKKPNNTHYWIRQAQTKPTGTFPIKPTMLVRRHFLPVGVTACHHVVSSSTESRFEGWGERGSTWLPRNASYFFFFFSIEVYACITCIYSETFYYSFNELKALSMLRHPDYWVM